MIRFLIGTLLFTLSSCKSAGPEENEPSIFNGYLMTKDSINEAPEIVHLDSCTGVAVSSNTVLTAAHCFVEYGGPSKDVLLNEDGETNITVCIKSKDGSNQRCSIKVYVHPEYKGSRHLGKADLAIVVFENGTFPAYFSIDQNFKPENREIVFLSGFSQIGLSKSQKREFGSKRWGKAQVHSIDQENGTIETQSAVSMVSLDPGDSGGPLFNDQCQVVGIASYISANASNDYVKNSFHSNLSFSRNQWFLGIHNGISASICGADKDKNFCLEKETYTYFPELSEAGELPCAPPSRHSDLLAKIKERSTTIANHAQQPRKSKPDVFSRSNPILGVNVKEEPSGLTITHVRDVALANKIPIGWLLKSVNQMPITSLADLIDALKFIAKNHSVDVLIIKMKKEEKVKSIKIPIGP